MFDVIKLFLSFIVFAIICEGVGLVLLKKLDIDNNIIALPIGMAVEGCLYEFLVLPVQYFNLDSSLLKYLLIISLIIMLIYGKKELKNIYKYLSKKDIILFVLFIAIFIIMSFDLEIYGVDYQCSDNLFYIPLINGISMDGIKVNGTDANLYINFFTTSKYTFYGQLHFLSALSNLLNIDSLLTINFFHKWYLIVFYLTNIYNIYYLCIKYRLLNKINNTIIFLFLIISFLTSLKMHETSLVTTTNILFVIVPLLFYLQDDNKGWLVLFVLLSIHAISIRSTFIFLLAFFLLPYYLYLLINNKFKIKENVYIISPTLFFLILYFSYGKSVFILLILLLLLACLIIFLPIVVNYIGNTKTRYLYYFILIIILLLFVIKSLFIGNIGSTWDSIPIYDLLKSYFLDFSSCLATANSVFYLSYLFISLYLLGYSIIKRKKISYIVLHSIFIFIFCINVFVAPYLASFLTQVYERLFWVWVNPLFYLLVLNEFVCTFDKSILQKAIAFPLSAVLIANILLINTSQYISYAYNNIKTFISKRKDINIYYKVGRDSLEIGKIIEEYAADEQMKYVQIACPINLLNSTFVSNKIRLSSLMGTYGTLQKFISFDFYTEKWNESKYDYPIYFYLLEPYRFFDDWHIENANSEIPDLESMFKDTNTELFVINKWENREETRYLFDEYFSSFSDMLYENDNYQIYVIRYE